MKIDLSETACSDQPMGARAEPCLGLTGRFDAFETPEFRSTIDELFEGGATTIRVDMSAISFVDSSALAELVRVHKHCRELGGDLIIVSPSDPVTVIFELTRLDSAFRIERKNPVAEVA